MVAVKINGIYPGTRAPSDSTPSKSNSSKPTISTVIMGIFNRLISDLCNLFSIKSKKSGSETPKTYAIFTGSGSCKFPKAPQSSSERDLGSIKLLNEKIDQIKQTDINDIKSCSKIDIETILEDIEKYLDNSNNIAVLNLALMVIKNLKDKELISDRTPAVPRIESELNQKIKQSNRSFF